MPLQVLTPYPPRDLHGFLEVTLAEMASPFAIGAAVVFGVYWGRRAGPVALAVLAGPVALAVCRWTLTARRLPRSYRKERLALSSRIFWAVAMATGTAATFL